MNYIVSPLPHRNNIPVRYLLYLALAAATLAGPTVCAQEEPTDDSMQKPQKFKRRITRTLRINYLLYLPKDYTAKTRQRWPLLLFLHGAGERGTNIWKVAVHGPPKLIKAKHDFPFIVVSPQCPPDERWNSETLIQLLDDVLDKYAVDPSRVYLTGLSMGGFGTWALAAEYPQRFAAVAPICGGGETIPILLAEPGKRAALKKLGVWAFHGAKDPVVALQESERMIAVLKKIGCSDLQLTVYPEATHDAWTETYDNPAIYEWLLKHRRPVK